MFYKLTDRDMKTYGRFQWEIGKWHEIPAEDQSGKLCSPGFFHCYDDPILAIIFNPIHSDFPEPRLFEVEVDGESKEDRGVKFGFTRMRLVREVELPVVTLEQRVEFGIRCAAKVYEEEEWVRWANGWLSGEDRSTNAADVSARAAAKVADDAAADAAAAAVYDADDDAYTAAYAAGAAAYAAGAAADVADADTAAGAAKVAAYAADNASTVNFAAIIKKIISR